MLIRHELRFHRRMTGLATELHGTGHVISLVAPDGAHEQKHEASDKEYGEISPVSFAGEINHQGWFELPACSPDLLTAIKQPAQHHQSEAQKQKSGGHHIAENSQVGTLSRRKYVEDEQQNEGKDAPQCDNQPGQADPIADERQANRRFWIGVSTHRSNTRMDNKSLRARQAIQSEARQPHQIQEPREGTTDLLLERANVGCQRLDFLL